MAVSKVNNSLFFISGCGSVLNVKGEVEMDAIVMDGKTLGSGAVSAVRNIANPVQLARLVMDKVCVDKADRFICLKIKVHTVCLWLQHS